MAVTLEKDPAARPGHSTACLWLLRVADLAAQAVQLEAFTQPTPGERLWMEPFLVWGGLAEGAPKLACISFPGEQRQLCAHAQEVLGCSVHYIRRPQALLLEAVWSPTGNAVALLCAHELRLYDAASGVQRACRLAFELEAVCCSWAACGCHLLLLPHNVAFAPADPATAGVLVNGRGVVVAADVQRRLGVAVQAVHCGAIGTVAVLGSLPRDEQSWTVQVCVWGGRPACLQPQQVLLAEPNARSVALSPDGLSCHWCESAHEAVLQVQLQRNGLLVKRHHWLLLADLVSETEQRIAAGSSHAHVPFGQSPSGAADLYPQAAWSPGGAHLALCSTTADASPDGLARRDLWFVARTE